MAKPYFVYREYKNDGQVLYMLQILTSNYYKVFLTKQKLSIKDIIYFVEIIYDQKYELNKISFINGNDILNHTSICWTEKEHFVVADSKCIDALHKELTEEDWSLEKEWVKNTLEDLQKMNTTIAAVVNINPNGCHCRSCNEFNSYAQPDGVVSDDKFTCWNCANSYMRVRVGLSSDFRNLIREVRAIQTLNKIKN